ncbi:transposase [Cohnella sp.]|uniref:transposase n=1 Tax=Cohnella sp. TaxID=1883426 RepID=UPI0035619636
MMHETLTFEQFCQQFEKEEDCVQALFAARWPGGFSCPRCTHQHFYEIRSRKMPLYECRSCHTQTSLIAGTIMAGSRTPLKLWFLAMFLHAQPEGLSATHLTSIIGTTYKTSWLICHKIRHAMSHADSHELLSGLVRVNWGNYGNPYNPTVFRHHQEQPLLVGASLGANGEFTQLKIKQVLDEHLQDNHISTYAGHVFKGQHVDPDALEVIIVNQKFSMNRFRPLIKICLQASQWINEIFKGIGPKHLQSYLDQFCFGYTRTKRSNNLFAVLLQQCSITPVLTYPHLIMRENNSSQYKNRYLYQLSKVS